LVDVPRALAIDSTGAVDLSELLDFIYGTVLQRRAFVVSSNNRTIMADKDDTLLNSREVAFLLDLSPDTVNEFARRSIFPAFKKGRQWRFRKRDIASFKRHLRGLNAAA
jgi:hypothetical protein